MRIDPMKRSLAGQVKGIAVNLLTCFFAAAVMTGCASSGEVLTDGSTNRVPVWVNRFPEDPAYYIGIGSSNRGDKSWDMEEARKKALANLAASISTEIRSEQVFEAREDSIGNNYQSAQIVISETVTQHLQEVETVDSYYSPDDGYWFFMRLNKGVWEQIQRNEIGKVEQRVLSIVEPVFADPEVAVSNRISTLWKAWDLLLASPYMGLIESQLNGNPGILIDLIEHQMVTLINSISIFIEPPQLETEPGRRPEVEIEVRTKGSVIPGTFYINLSLKNDRERIITSVVTGRQGDFIGEIDLIGLPAGKTMLTAELDLSQYGIDIARIPGSVLIPERDILVEIKQIKAGLQIVEPEESALQNTFSAFKALLAERLPITIAEPGSDDTYTITVEIQMRNTPESEQGLYFSYQRIYIGVDKEGGSLYTFESPEVKEGGLSSEQAQTRTFSRLVEVIRENNEFVENIQRVFAYE